MYEGLSSFSYPIVCVCAIDRSCFFVKHNKTDCCMSYIKSLPEEVISNTPNITNIFGRCCTKDMLYLCNRALLPIVDPNCNTFSKFYNIQNSTSFSSTDAKNNTVITTDVINFFSYIVAIGSLAIIKIV